MQTFLPYPHFEKTAQCLDYRRLGKQRVEAKQILEVNLKVKNPEEYFVCFACKREFENFEIYNHYAHSLEVTDYRPLDLNTARRINRWAIKWENHPAVLMWRGYEWALAEYGCAICDEWVKRGYKDSLLEFFEDNILENDIDYEMIYPPWLGDERLHSSHRAALLAKNLEYYNQFGWTEESKIKYYWPIRKEQ